MPYQERARVGNRRHRATVSEHDGSTDLHGTPTYDDDEHWYDVIASLPIELLTVQGGEQLRGRQVADNTTHLAYCEYHGGSSITPEMRCVINGLTYQIQSVMDIDGDSRELRIELRREV